MAISIVNKMGGGISSSRAGGPKASPTGIFYANKQGGARLASVTGATRAQTGTNALLIKKGGAIAGVGLDYRKTVIADVPLSYWRLEESSGTVANDEMGIVNGVYSGAGLLLNQTPVGIRSGGVAAKFSGTSGGRVDFPSAYDFAGRAPFSVEAWINRDTGSDQTIYRRVIDKGTSTVPRDGWSFLVVPENHPLDYLRNRMDFERWGQGTSSNVAGGIKIEPFTWYHIVATYDGTNLRLYVNGILQQTSTSTVAMLGNTFPLRIGADGQNGGNTFSGLIDEVAIYNYTLSQAQITNHFRVGAGTFFGAKRLTLGKTSGGILQGKTGASKAGLASKTGGGITIPVGRATKAITAAKSSGAISISKSGVLKFVTAQKSGGGRIVKSAGGVDNFFVAIGKSGGSRTELWSGVISHRLLNVKTGGLKNPVVAGGVFRALKPRSGGSITPVNAGAPKILAYIRRSGGISSLINGGVRATARQKGGGATVINIAGGIRWNTHRKFGGATQPLRAGGIYKKLQAKSGGSLIVSVAGGATAQLRKKYGGVVAALASGATKTWRAAKVAGTISRLFGGARAAQIGPPVSPSTLFTRPRAPLSATEDTPVLLTVDIEEPQLEEVIVEKPLLLKAR